MTGATHDYVVLARKYRPRSFAELYGQDALVRTLTNAIQSNKIHHAYVLTGIRGVGKTTTARIIAKALNCAGGPSITWDETDPQVQAITAGTHMDVLEFDAASNRGVDEVSKLFEGIAYAPVQGRYKVYIIDEVHMLSNTAFNSLLKTLEEPPPNVKFIFATTEVNKIPVTVLSRCQRFDLKRIPSETLIKLFTDILAKENLQAEPAAVAMVARAADGSARDGLSLLDQAIALAHGGSVSADLVQNMLGLADKARLYDILDNILAGHVPATLAILDDLYARGQDALGVVQGLLETIHLLTRLQVVPALAQSPTLTEIERTRAIPLSQKITRANGSRLYQMLAHVATDIKQAERPYEALGMAMVRMAYLAPLPPITMLLNEATQVVQNTAPTPSISKDAGAAATPVPARMIPPSPPPMPTPPWEEESPAAVASPTYAPIPATWPALVESVKTAKAGLAATLGQQVRCLRLEGTTLDVAIDRGLHDAKEIMRDLRLVMRTITGTEWTIQQAAADTTVPTLKEANDQKVAATKSIAAADPAVKDVLAMFPGAEVEDVRLNSTPH